MRPSSAGSSRTSKWVLPPLNEAAISIANPLTGTGAPVAGVTLNGKLTLGENAAEAGFLAVSDEGVGGRIAAVPVDGGGEPGRCDRDQGIDPDQR